MHIWHVFQPSILQRCSTENTMWIWVILLSRPTLICCSYALRHHSLFMPVILWCTYTVKGIGNLAAASQTFFSQYLWYQQWLTHSYSMVHTHILGNDSTPCSSCKVVWNPWYIPEVYIHTKWANGGGVTFAVAPDLWHFLLRSAMTRDIAHTCPITSI